MESPRSPRLSDEASVEAARVPTSTSSDFIQMEEDDSSSTFTNPADTSAVVTANLNSLPVEIHAQILSYLDPIDCLSYGKVCRVTARAAECNQVWKRQWLKLSKETPFIFLNDLDQLSELGINFKDVCKRLWRVLVRQTQEFGDYTPAKCIHCREYTCLAECIEEIRSNRVSLDIGGKFTWLVTTNYDLKRHLSMIAVPKTLKCYDCDTTFCRSDYQCDCKQQQSSATAMAAPPYGSALNCRSRYNMSTHTALEYCSQKLSDIAKCGVLGATRGSDPPRLRAHNSSAALQAELSKPFCLFCEDEKCSRMLCERNMVSSAKLKMKKSTAGSWGPTGSSSVPSSTVVPEDDFLNYSAVSPLTNGYCRDTAAILDAHNLDLVSPLLAMEHHDAFPIVKAFLSHIFKLYDMVDSLQKPNSSFILTEPGRLPLSVKESLLTFLFEEVKVARVCLLPKALAISKLFDVDTCIVVDSGATSTSVWVVVDGKVDESKTQTVSVGGWHVSHFLKQAMTWKDKKEAVGATVSSLDTSQVKQKCRLSLNLARENDMVHQGHSLHIRGQPPPHHTSSSHRHSGGGGGGGGGGGRLEQLEVTLSSELYLAPEMMYASLDLPAMVNEATKDLERHLVKDCFSNILITGGNTDLQGFSQRFASDLRELLPEHSPIIDVKPYPTGNHSWNTVMGANAVHAPAPYDTLLHQPGHALHMTREEYITFGCQRIAAADDDIGEG